MTSLKDETVATTAFNNFQASERLKRLAENPFDLTLPGNLTPARITKMCSECCGLRLIYATERVDENTISALEELAKEAKVFEKLQKMMSGDVVNFIQGFPSENRPALHTATRDFFEDAQKSKTAQDATKLAWNEVEKLKVFMEQIDKENKFTDMIVVAIGGSELGPKASYLGLEHLQKFGRNVHFIGNIDPDNVSEVVKKVNLSHTLVLVISKSGSTLETTVNDQFLRDIYAKAGLKPEEHFIAVTGEGSPLDDPKQYLASFHIWDWVGGRYSTSSMVGGVLFSFAFGFPVYWEFLRGANAMDKAVLNPKIDENIALLDALLTVWNHNFLNYPTIAVVPYCVALSRFSAHLQQVEMESNGKRIDQQGKPVDFETSPIIWGEPGTNAQHSFYQMIHQGTAVVPVELIGFKECQRGLDKVMNGSTSQEKLLSNLIAQAIALATGKDNKNPNKVFPGNRPSHVIFGKQLTPFIMGALLALYEHKTAIQGFIWGINSFDQEGVQLGKELANKVIQRFTIKRGGDNVEPYPMGDAFIAHLHTLKD